MSRRTPDGGRRWRPLLLSALVFPGLGQLASGRRLRALAFAGGVMALLLALAQRVWVETQARLPDDPGELLDPAWPFRLADEIRRANESFFVWITVGLLLLWAGSIAEAWLAGPAAVRTDAVPPPRSGNPDGRGQSVRFCSHCGSSLPGPPPVTCPACATNHWLNAKPCAGALVTRDGRLLLVRRACEPWRGLWDVPGGFCGPQEHPAAAAAREVREETGLVVRVGAILGMWMDRYAPDGPGADEATLNIYFRATVDGVATPGADPDEVVEVGWFGPDELPREIAFPGHLPAVLRAWKAMLC